MTAGGGAGPDGAGGRCFMLENPSLNRFGKAPDACLPAAIKQAVPDWITYPIKKLLRKRQEEPDPRCDT